MFSLQQCDIDGLALKRTLAIIVTESHLPSFRHVNDNKGFAGTHNQALFKHQSF